MKTRTGDEMFLSASAEEVARQLYDAGASFTSGHRDVGQQAVAMATNIIASGNRRWIADTYLCPGPLQVMVDFHPESDTVPLLTTLLHEGLHSMTPEQVGRLSHHFMLPCPVFDMDPDSVTDSAQKILEILMKQGTIIKLIAREGGLRRYHVECASLPLNKVVLV